MQSSHTGCRAVAWYTFKLLAGVNVAALQDAPFFTVKLNVKVLPCVIMFSTGVAVDRVAGFDEFGAKDDFSTDAGATWAAPRRLHCSCS